MVAISQDAPIYFGKLGADNLLLMLCGALHLVAYWLKSGQGRRLDAMEGVFFLVYGFTHDLYRFKPLRPYLLINHSFVVYRSIVLCACLLPVYIQLVIDIHALLIKRYGKTTRIGGEQ